VCVLLRPPRLLLLRLLLQRLPLSLLRGAALPGQARLLLLLLSLLPRAVPATTASASAGVRPICSYKVALLPARPLLQPMPYTKG
jgi:hypothetical protein